MIETAIAPTNDYYRQIIDTLDAPTRQQRYVDLLVTPWQHMMQMVSGPPGDGAPDPLAGARAWNWLLPDQVDQIAALLGKLEAAGAWEVAAEALTAAAVRFVPYAAQIPFATISGWLMLADPARSNPFERGYTGATDWMQPRFIGQFWDPNAYNLPRLPGLVAHEMHHLIRLRAFPWDMMKTSVADYIVIEGTAEAFAASLFGAENIGTFITEFDETARETARHLIGGALEKTGFNTIRGYIFGDALAEQSGFEPVGGMPTYGGYVVGYQVVRAFLERTGTTIEEATFLPAREIVRRSGYF